MKECYSPEKLTFYFFNIMWGINFLNENNIFYSDMKPDNVLIFRSQQAKLGDLGVSCKLIGSPDPNKKQFLIKGCTNGFVTSKFIKKFDQNEKFSKAELFEADKYAL